MVVLGVRLRNVTLPNDMEDLKDWVRWAASTGYEVVDVAELTEEVKELVDQEGLKVGTYDANMVPQLFSRDEAKQNAALESVLKQIADSAKLSRTSTCFMCLKPEDNAMPRKEAFDMYTKVFPMIASEAEKWGVKIVFEGWPGPAPYHPTLGCTPETLRAMFEAVPSSSLCVNYDPSHLVRLGIDYIRFLREFKDRIAHVHLKDCVFNEENLYLYGRQAAAFDQPIKYSEGPWRYTIPGEGSVDWKTVLFELELAGYTGPACVELEDHRYNNSVEDRRRGFKNTLTYISAYLR